MTTPTKTPQTSSITIIGSLNIDLVTLTPRVPGPGETLTATSFSTGFGGKGANQAVACARLLRPSAQSPPQDGVRVSMVGAVGEDQFGVDFKAHLGREGVECGGVGVKEGLKTGTAVILVEEGSGENRILLAPGANGAVEVGDVGVGEEGGGVVLFQLELPVPTVIECVRIAKERGKKVILNPAPAVPLPDEVYKDLDHLILNESEASLLSGISEERLSDDLELVANHFQKLGVKVLVVTLGSKGVYWRDEKRAKNNSKGNFVSAHKVPVVDTTAAGDTFVGAYAVWLTRNSADDVDGAVRFANRAASLAVQKAGAQASIPFLDEVGAQ